MQRRLLALALSAVIASLAGNPALAAEKATPAPPAASQAKAAAKKPPARMVDINSASKVELKTLPGIGDAEADRIIQARPYPSKAKLAVDKVISDQLYAGLQGRIVAAQPASAKAKTAAKAASKP